MHTHKASSLSFHRTHSLPHCLSVDGYSAHKHTHAHSMVFHFFTLGRRWTHIVDCWVKRRRAHRHTHIYSPHSHRPRLLFSLSLSPLFFNPKCPRRSAYRGANTECVLYLTVFYSPARYTDQALQYDHWQVKWITLIILHHVSGCDILGSKQTFCPQSWFVRRKKTGQA